MRPDTAAWTPLEWRIVFALVLLAMSGAGAWLLSFVSLYRLAELSALTREVWPLAYFSFAALAVLALSSVSFAVVVGLRNFRAELPGGFSVEASAGDKTVTATTHLEIDP